MRRGEVTRVRGPRPSTALERESSQRLASSVKRSASNRSTMPVEIGPQTLAGQSAAVMVNRGTPEQFARRGAAYRWTVLNGVFADGEKLHRGDGCASPYPQSGEGIGGGWMNGEIAPRDASCRAASVSNRSTSEMCAGVPLEITRPGMTRP